jgi:outer membrane protein OmpA-like peptidoglycan-associated protein
MADNLRQTLQVAALICGLSLAGSVYAQTTWNDVDKINANFDKWKKIPEFQKPGEIQKAGDIQIPKGVQAVTEKCKQRLLIGADTLFDFDKADLTSKSAAILGQLGPVIQQYGNHPITVEGHTDGKGSDEYNQDLSERRAKIVRDWLVYYKYIPNAQVIGYGKRKPVAPNTNADGSDNPAGRAKNRRVEIVIDTCH